MKTSHALALALSAAFAILPTAASAQWQWIDRQGKKVFSDQAPPPETPDRSILQRPGMPAPRTAFDPASAPSSAAKEGPAPIGRNAPGNAPRPGGVDRELEEKTRKADADDKARQDAEREKVARAKSDNCSRARQGKAAFDSGIRVARLNAQGEREIMDDTARAAENQRLQSVIDSDCS